MGRSRSAVPVCSNRVPARCPTVAATAARDNPFAIAAVPAGSYRARLTVDGYDEPIELCATTRLGDGIIEVTDRIHQPMIERL